MLKNLIHARHCAVFLNTANLTIISDKEREAQRSYIHADSFALKWRSHYSNPWLSGPKA